MLKDKSATKMLDYFHFPPRILAYEFPLVYAKSERNIASNFMLYISAFVFSFAQ